MAAADTDDRTLRRGRSSAVPHVAAGPAFLYLFFLVPLDTLLKISLSAQPERRSTNVDFAWEWGNFSKAFTDFGTHLWRAFAYAGVATVLCILIAYPLAYFIAFKAGKWREPPARAGDGAVLHELPAAHDRLAVAVRRQRAGPRIVESFSLSGLLDADRAHRPTGGSQHPAAVIGGLTYNFLPFALLPIYVSLEKIRPNLIDAAADLYSPLPADVPAGRSCRCRCRACSPARC